MTSIIPRPDIRDGVPRCSAQCPAYRRREDAGYQLPFCEVTAEEWPEGRICRPGIQRAHDLLTKYRAHRWACDAYWAGVGNAVDQDEAMRRFQAMSDAAAVLKEADPHVDR